VANAAQSDSFTKQDRAMNISHLPAFLKPFFRSVCASMTRPQRAHLWALVLALALNLRTSKLTHLARLLPFSTHRTRHGAFLASDGFDSPRLLRETVARLIKRLNPRAGETIELILDDHRIAKRGKKMDRLSKIWDHKEQKFVHGHIVLFAAICFRGVVMPLRLHLWKPKGQSGPRYRKLTDLAAEMIRQFDVPAGLKVRVLFDAFYLSPVVVKACEKREFAWFSVAARNRCLRREGEKGRGKKIGDFAPGLLRHHGRCVHMKRSRGVAKLKIASVNGHLSRIGQVRMVISKRPHETWNSTIAIVTNAAGMDARAIVAAYERRWNIEVMFKDLEQSLGLGEYQMLHERAIVNHQHLICLAHLMLTHHAINGTGEKAITSNKEVRLPSIEQRIESLRKAHRDDRIKKLFRKGSLHARYRKKLDTILQAA
jgi:SRSO17 transposase